MPEVGNDLVKRGFVVAIDGPAGAGKSTLARALASRLGLPYVNTGLMYRALASRSLELGLDPEDGPGLGAAARGIGFSMRAGGETTELAIDGGAPGPELTRSEVEWVVSRTSSHPEVRAVMRAEQRRLGVGGCVMEGRDIGSVVFPDADVKIFLSARPAERTRRRARERPADGTATGVVRRDRLDHRTNPLEPAEGAVVIDTTGLSPRTVLDRAVEVVATASPAPGQEAGT